MEKSMTVPIKIINRMPFIFQNGCWRGWAIIIINSRQIILANYRYSFFFRSTSDTETFRKLFLRRSFFFIFPSSAHPSRIRPIIEFSEWSGNELEDLHVQCKKKKKIGNLLLRGQTCKTFKNSSSINYTGV